jgi:transposase-like protein
VARLNRELNIVLARPDVRAQLVQQAFEVQSSTAAELGVHVKTQLDLWRKAVLESGLTLE